MCHLHDVVITACVTVCGGGHMRRTGFNPKFLSYSLLAEKYSAQWYMGLYCNYSKTNISLIASFYCIAYKICKSSMKKNLIHIKWCRKLQWWGKIVNYRSYSTIIAYWIATCSMTSWCEDWNWHVTSQNRMYEWMSGEIVEYSWVDGLEQVKCHSESDMKDWQCWLWLLLLLLLAVAAWLAIKQTLRVVP